MNAHSNKSEQASEITMTPALYHCITQTWQHVLSACVLNDYKTINNYVTAIYIVQQYRAGQARRKQNHSATVKFLAGADLALTEGGC